MPILQKEAWASGRRLAPIYSWKCGSRRRTIFLPQESPQPCLHLCLTLWACLPGAPFSEHAGQGGMLQRGSFHYTERAACQTSAEHGPRALMDVSPQLKDDTRRREPSSTDRCGQRYCRPGICPWTSPPHCSMLTFLFSGVSTSCQLLALRW